jgi:hypothetical protein
MMAAMKAQAQNMPKGPPGAPPGTPGIPGAPGGAIPGAPNAGGPNVAGAGGPADFNSPVGAVSAFLDALKAKDLKRLSEATALRASAEAKGVKNQKLFASITDESMTEDDLSELANKLEGYQVVGMNDFKSSGRAGVTLGKQATNGDYHQRTVIVRKEKAGWKVADIGGQGTVKSGMPRSTRRSAR